MSRFKTWPLFCALVLPSYVETNANVVADAMAAGKPVVATKVGGIPDMIEDGKSGFLVDCKDINSLSEKISILLSDKELRQKMGREARKLAKTKYAEAVCARRTREVYEEILKEWKYKA